MTNRRWHITREGDTLTLARRLPAKMDVSATTRLPAVRRGRVAHQVRQDLWRALQSLRGFAPVVTVTRDAGGLIVEAGGEVAGAVPPGTQGRIADLLEDPVCRARWVAHGGRV